MSDCTTAWIEQIARYSNEYRRRYFCVQRAASILLTAKVAIPRVLNPPFSLERRGCYATSTGGRKPELKYRGRSKPNAPRPQSLFHVPHGQQSCCQERRPGWDTVHRPFAPPLTTVGLGHWAAFSQDRDVVLRYAFAFPIALGANYVSSIPQSHRFHTRRDR